MAKPILNLLVCLLVYFTCYGEVYSQETGKKNKPEVLDEAMGDLDKDGIPERVVVYNTNRSTDSSTIRELHIYKKKGNGWILWKTSEKAIKKSEEGGMMGDPFEEVKVEKGILLISHAGGSSWKWNEVHKYRFQNGDFRLIGVSSHYGKLCEYWQSFDYNLSVRKVSYKKELETCDEQGEQKSSKTETEEFIIKVQTLPTLSSINLGENQIISPKLKVELYY